MVFEKIKAENERLKEVFKSRIEKNAVKTELSWTDKDGILQTEIVYLKRSSLPLGDWHRIYPPVDEVTNKWNKANLIFGGKKNLFKLILIALVMVLFFLSFIEMSSNYNTLAELPCVRNCLNPINIK